MEGIRRARISPIRLIGVFAVAALLIAMLARPASEAKTGTPEEIAALIAASMAAYALAGSPPGVILLRAPQRRLRLRTLRPLQPTYPRGTTHCPNLVLESSPV